MLRLRWDASIVAATEITSTFDKCSRDILIIVCTVLHVTFLFPRLSFCLPRPTHFDKSDSYKVSAGAIFMEIKKRRLIVVLFVPSRADSYH